VRQSIAVTTTGDDSRKIHECGIALIGKFCVTAVDGNEWVTDKVDCGAPVFPSVIPLACHARDDHIE
jgi:hypothetical protein